MEFFVLILVCWLSFLTWKCWGYRNAIIEIQKDLSSDGGILDELTRPR